MPGSPAPSAGAAARWEGFPQPGPVAGADPSIRHKVTIQVPTKFKFSRTNDGVIARIDETQQELVEISVGLKMLMGVQIEGYFYPSGQDRPKENNLGGSLSGASEDKVSFEWGRGPVKMDRKAKYTYELVLSVFETDIPAQHLWSPQGGKFKVLWTRSLVQEIDSAGTRSTLVPFGGFVTQPPSVHDLKWYHSLDWAGAQFMGVWGGDHLSLLTSETRLSTADPDSRDLLRWIPRLAFAVEPVSGSDPDWRRECWLYEDGSMARWQPLPLPPLLPFPPASPAPAR